MKLIDLLEVLLEFQYVKVTNNMGDILMEGLMEHIDLDATDSKRDIYMREVTEVYNSNMEDALVIEVL